MHRGRRLVDTPDGAKNACGRARKSFVCGFHGWTYDQDGAYTHIREPQDWQGTLTPREHPPGRGEGGHLGWLDVHQHGSRLRSAGGLHVPGRQVLEPFGLEKMRYKWRQWANFDCNWKVAMEAFNETYHVARTHPQLNRFGD